MNEHESKPKAQPQLEPSRFHLAEHQRNVYVATVEGGIARADMLAPEFWSHIAAKLRPYDEIVVYCDDGSLYARMLVLNSERTWARMHVLQWEDLTTRDVSLSKGAPAAKAASPEVEKALFRVEYKGKHKQWCVIRENTNPPEYIREQEVSKANANLWLAEYLKVTT